jgi:uncharacterized protein (TIGR03067 family)
MKPMIAFVACVLLLGADDKAKKADPLSGTWKVSSLVAGGEEREQAKGSVYTFKDGTLTMKGMRGERKSTYKLDASKKPATIDMTAKGGQRDGMTTKGIFEVKGDELKLCFDFMGGDERPKMFDGSNGSMVLVTLKREKQSEEKK